MRERRGELKKEQSGGRRSEKGVLSPLCVQVSVRKRKSSFREVKKSFSHVVLVVIDLILSRAMCSVVAGGAVGVERLSGRRWERTAPPLQCLGVMGL